MPSEAEKLDAAESRLMAAYKAASDAPPNVPLQSSIVEMMRKNEHGGGLSLDDMEYWAQRLEDLTAAALDPHHP